MRVFNIVFGFAAVFFRRGRTLQYSAADKPSAVSLIVQRPANLEPRLTLLYISPRLLYICGSVDEPLNCTSRQSRPRFMPTERIPGTVAEIDMHRVSLIAVLKG